MSAKENAKKLIKALGAQAGEDIANAHVTQAAAEIGLAEPDLDEALSYAREKGWIDTGSREGTTCITQDGWDSGNA